jgi:hypothetical protein
VALTHGPAPLPDDIVAKSRAAAATIVVTGQPELAPAGPDPSGFERFERNGLSIAAATGRYELEESNDHCLFLRGDNESLDVTFTPLAGSELLADQNERAWSGLDGAPLSRTEPEPGRVLLEGVDPEGDAHVVYLIDSGAGTYQIRLLALDQSALPPEELADLVQMATTLEVTGETAAD